MAFNATLSAIVAIYSPFGFDVPSLPISRQRTTIMICPLQQSTLSGLLSNCQISRQESTWIICSIPQTFWCIVPGTGVGARCCKDKQPWLAFVYHSEGGEEWGSGQTTSGEDQGGKDGGLPGLPQSVGSIHL